MTILEKVRKDIRPAALEGISADQIAQHWALYEGYVKNARILEDKLARLAKNGDDSPEFAELKRRWSFEANGVVLHELYFEALKKGQPPLGEHAQLTKQLKKFFGGFEAWKKEFIRVAKMRGAGWAILYYDRRTKILTNVSIASHENGHPAGSVPILVLDVWEHAYMVDWGASGRPEYIEAFFRNVDWACVEARFHEAARNSD
jgi:Fe-Mn family superoxide dismutase